jgi:dTDP-4-amino-4,6-dideoxygalactose transaminase
VFRSPIPLSGTDLGEEEYLLVQEVLGSGRLSKGPMIERLEHEFAERFGARHAIGVSSGTAALHLSVLAAGVRDGDMVITTPFSFIASANPILYERAIPVFVDIDPHTLTIDSAAAADAIETLTSRRAGWERLLPPNCAPPEGKLRAIIPVDTFGRVAEMRDITAAAHAAGIAVIEDACEAVGAELDGVPAGRWGDAGTFAFYPNKQMTTGEGGLVLTDRDDWAQEIRSLRSQGVSDDHSWLRHQRIGYNYRLDELSAAVGLAQLRRLDELLRAREAVAAMYTERLRNIAGIEPLPRPRLGMRISWFLYIVRVAEGIERDALMATLAERGIPTRPYFWPIHLQPPYQERFGFQPGAYPHAEKAGQSLLALPFHGNLTEGEVDHICESITEVVSRREARQYR